MKYGLILNRSPAELIHLSDCCEDGRVYILV
jgi:hypothetical protein